MLASIATETAARSQTKVNLLKLASTGYEKSMRMPGLFLKCILIAKYTLKMERNTASIHPFDSIVASSVAVVTMSPLNRSKQLILEAFCILKDFNPPQRMDTSKNASEQTSGAQRKSHTSTTNSTSKVVA